MTADYTALWHWVKGESKSNVVAKKTIGALWMERERLASFFSSGVTPTMRGFHARHDGWGPFLAYQAVVDMRFCPSLLASASDRETWAAAGPGTLRGLNRVHGRRVDARLSQSYALSEMREIHRLSFDATGVEMDFSDVPNILCETDKYLRVKMGEGKPRALYVPGRGS